MGSRCRCRYSGPANMMRGLHKDPIASEKVWLDFAVRELSRVAAGKAQGQEAVWRKECKPKWWKAGLTWKNPTANPKDTKDTLSEKFECLVQHLRKENRLPEEMKEEIALWEAGRKPEVYLMTDISSILRQAGNLHSVLDDMYNKMISSKTRISPDIFTDLQTCLSSSLSKIDAIKSISFNEKQNTKDQRSSKNPRKRPACETLSSSLQSSDSKRFKHSHSSAQIQSTSSSLSLSCTPSQNSELIQPVSNNKVFKSELAANLREHLKKKSASRHHEEVSVGDETVEEFHKKRANSPAYAEKTVSPDYAQQSNDTEATLELPLIDFEENIAGFNPNFLDNLLEETSIPNITMTPVENTTASGKHHPMTCINSSEDSPLILEELSMINDRPTDINLHDPVLCQVDSDVFSPTMNSTYCELVPEITADRFAGSSLSPPTELGSSSSEVHETAEIVSDSGYETSSPLSLRNSLDSDSYSLNDLGSPDLEAFIDSL